MLLEPAGFPSTFPRHRKRRRNKTYFFSSVDANRVRFSIDRDVTSSPKQDGPGLNYFIYPYIEIDGKTYDKFDKHFNFEELNASK